MARPRKDWNTLPRKHWKDFLNEDGYNAGVLSTAPHAEMLGEGGAIRYVKLSSDKRIPVIYDAEYCLHYFHRRIVVGMGFYSGGNLELEMLREFLKEVIRYSKAIAKEHEEKDAIAQSHELASKYPHMSQQEWLATLIKKE